MRLVDIATVVVIAVGVSACGDHGHPAAGPPASGTPSGKAHTETPPLSVEHAPPVQRLARVVGHIVQAPRSGMTVAVAGLGARGETLLNVSRASLPLTQGRLQLLSSPGTPTRLARTLPLGPFRQRAQQVKGGLVLARFVVWQETSSASLNQDRWIMYAYDRRTHHTSELTHAPDKSDGSPPPFVPGYTTVSGYGHRIAWAQATGTVTHSRVDIFTCSLPHCVPRLAVARAGFPQVTSHGIYAIRFNQDVFGIRRHKNLDQAHFRIVFEHSSQSAVRLVQRLPAGGQTSSVTGFAASDDVQIVTELFRPKGTRALIRYHAKLLKVRGRVGQFSQLFSYPVVGKGFVAWAESSGSATQLGGYLLDLANRRVYSLGNQGGLYGIWAAGPYVAWQQQIGPGSGPPSVVDLVAKVN